MSSLNGQVLSSLICPSCDNYMADLIYECVRGHSLCHMCSNTHKCPICQAKILNTRNFALESISNIVSYPCHLGCNMFFKHKELEQHVLMCSHRIYPCQLDNSCDWTGKKGDILAHSLQNHENNVILGCESLRLWKDTKPERSVLLMIAYDAQFYIHRILKGGIMYWTVQYIGKSEDIIMYYYKIDFFTDQFKHRCVTFSDICHDDTKKEVDEIFETGYCVAMPVSVLETFKNGQGVVLYKISIREA